jgi:hypothetical protein
VVGAPGPMAPRKTSPIVWILVIVLGFFVVGGIATAGFVYVVVHKAKQAGLDADLLSHNPGLAVAKMIAAANPDAEVLSTDDGAGKITIRDRKSGKVVTMSFDEARKGKFSFEAEGPNHEHASLEFNGNGANIPSDVPVYPGAKAQGNFSVTGNGADGQGTASQTQFNTSDPASKVLAYYHEKFESSGMKLALNTTSDDGGMLVAEDDPTGRMVTVIVGHGSEGTTISVTTRSKK